MALQQDRDMTEVEAFDGHDFQPYGLLPAIQVELGGKSISIHIEVVDTPLDYNLLLGRNWFYAMQVVASSIFWIVQLPFLGRLVTIDQLDFQITTKISRNNIHRTILD